MLWTLLTAFAVANDGPLPDLFAEQVGPDVSLTLRLHEDGEPGISNRFDLRRDGALVFGDRGFDPGDADATGRYCSGGDSVLYGPLDTAIDCDERPDLCETCGDSEVVCPIGGCYTSYDFDHLDACVPPGERRYTLREAGDDYVAASITLDVVDSGEACRAEGVRAAGCGCETSSPSTWTPGYALGALMLVLGLAFRPRHA